MLGLLSSLPHTPHAALDTGNAAVWSLDLATAPQQNAAVELTSAVGLNAAAGGWQETVDIGSVSTYGSGLTGTVWEGHATGRRDSSHTALDMSVCGHPLLPLLRNTGLWNFNALTEGTTQADSDGTTVIKRGTSPCGLPADATGQAVCPEAWITGAGGAAVPALVPGRFGQGLNIASGLLNWGELMVCWRSLSGWQLAYPTGHTQVLCQAGPPAHLFIAATFPALCLCPAGQLFAAPLQQSAPGTTGYSIGAWIKFSSQPDGRCVLVVAAALTVL